MTTPVMVGTTRSGPEIAGVAKRDVTPTVTCARTTSAGVECMKYTGVGVERPQAAAAEHWGTP